MPDKEWVIRAQRGDQSALEAIVYTYYDDVYRYLYRKLGNAFDAQDVTQEVFVTFFGSLPRYRERGRLRHYLLRLACNASHDVFRRSRNDLPLEDAASRADAAADVQDTLQTKSERQAVSDDLQALPAFQRDVIILRFYHELPFGDIARITDSKVSTVKSRYRQGMDKLKKHLEVTFHES